MELERRAGRWAVGVVVPAATLDRGGVRVTFVGLTDPTATQRQPPDEARGRHSTRHGTGAPRSDGRAVAIDLPGPVSSQDAVLAASGGGASPERAP